MAAANAAVKLGSFVNDEAICSTKNCRTSGESILGAGFAVLVSLLLDLGFVKSRVMLGEDGTREATQRFEPEVASS